VLTVIKIKKEEHQSLSRRIYREEIDFSDSDMRYGISKDIMPSIFSHIRFHGSGLLSYFISYLSTFG